MRYKGSSIIGSLTPREITLSDMTPVILPKPPKRRPGMGIKNLYVYGEGIL
jgi:hypothetical protein